MSLCGEALYLNLTYRCNSRCQFCAADVAYYRNPRFLSMQEIQSLIGGREYLDIILSGGEPTLHPGIVDIIKTCRAHSPCVTALTHGRSLKSRSFVERLLKAGMNYLIIPFYGYDAVTHDSVTGAPGSFHQTWEGLENLQSFRGEHCFFVEIKLLLTRYTAGLNSRIYRTLRDGVPDALNQISLCPLIYSRSTQDHSDRYAATWREMKESFSAFISEVRSDGIFKLRLNEFPPCFFQDEELRAFAHPQMENAAAGGLYFYGDSCCTERVDLDTGEFVKTRKGNAFVNSCRQCKYDAYCGSLITSLFSESYLEQRGESEFQPVR